MMSSGDADGGGRLKLPLIRHPCNLLPYYKLCLPHPSLQKQLQLHHLMQQQFCLYVSSLAVNENASMVHIIHSRHRQPLNPAGRSPAPLDEVMLPGHHNGVCPTLRGHHDCRWLLILSGAGSAAKELEIAAPLRKSLQEPLVVWGASSALALLTLPTRNQTNAKLPGA